MSDFLISPELLQYASPGQLERYKDLLRAKKAKEGLIDYMLYVTPGAKAHRHTVYVASLLEAVADWRLYKSGIGPKAINVDVSPELPKGRWVHPETGEKAIRKLMVSMPPQIGKSFIIGRHFPSWWLTSHPEDPIIYMSYAAPLAENYSADNKNNIEQHPELGIDLRGDTQSRKEFKLAGHEGGLVARGFGGIPTGKPAKGLIVDDAFQDGEEAMNENRRDWVEMQYVSGILPRVHEGAFEIHLYTRWHNDDLGGRILKREEEEWFVVNLPALAFDSVNEEGISVDPETGAVDPLGRKPGEAICPEIASADFYRKRRDRDPFWFDAQYQGKPAGVSGTMFKRFAHYKRHIDDKGHSTYELFNLDGTVEFVREQDCVRFATVDFAVTTKESSDWTVAGIWDLDPQRRLFLRHIERDRVAYDDQEAWVRRIHAEWGLQVTGLEKSTYHFGFVQHMIAEGGLNVWPLKCDADKTVRAIDAAGLASLGLIIVDRDAEWRAEYESEMFEFNRGAHDDQVDVTSYSTVIRTMLQEKPPPPKKKEPTGLTAFQERMVELAHKAPEKKDKGGMVINAT